MCKRSATDPLADFFFEKYRLHLLALPRAGAAVGDCYIVTPRGILDSNPIGQLTLNQLEMPHKNKEDLADIANQISRSIQINAGMSLLGSFLQAIGVGAFVQSAKANMEAKGARKLAFQLQHATREWISPVEWMRALDGERFISAVVDRKYRYLLTTAVVRTLSLTVRAEGESGSKIEVGVGTLAGTGSAKFEVSSTPSGEVTIKTETPLAIAVELLELLYDEARGVFRIQPLLDSERLRGHEETDAHLLALENDLALATVSQREAASKQT